MKKILIVSGCSYTNKDWQSYIHPEMDCSWPKWPELLAKKIDMDCINLGKSGAGQEYIYSSLLEEIVKTKKDRIGLVMAAWSGARRDDYEFLTKYGTVGWTNVLKSEEFDFGSRKPVIEYFLNRSIRYIFSLQILCERYNLPLKQFQMVRLFSPQKTKNRKNFISKKILNSIFIDKINEDDFIGWPPTKELGGFNFIDILGDNYDISEEDFHPNAEGQKFIAEFLYENIRS